MKKPSKVLSALDDNVVVPSAVRNAAARAEEIYAQAYPTPAAGEAPVVEPDVPIETIVLEPELNLQPPLNGAPPSNAPVPTAPTVQTPPAPDAGLSGDQDWERMYRSAQGRVERLTATNTQLTARVSEIERLLATAPAPAPVVAPAPARLLTEQEESEYGTEFLDVVGRRAREMVTPELARIDQRVQELDRRLQAADTITSMSAREQMEQTLNARVPSWREVNFDPKFLEWLRLPDSFSGVTRHALLTQAFERNETSRVQAIFNGFLSEEAATVPQGDQPHPTAPVTPEGKIPLETLAAPGRARTAAAAPAAPAEKPTFTRAQISKFYIDVAAGKYRGKDEEKDRIEKAIFAANNEGRVR